MEFRTSDPLALRVIKLNHDHAHLASTATILLDLMRSSIGEKLAHWRTSTCFCSHKKMWKRIREYHSYYQRQRINNIKFWMKETRYKETKVENNVYRLELIRLKRIIGSKNLIFVSRIVIIQINVFKISFVKTNSKLSK